MINRRTLIAGGLAGAATASLGTTGKTESISASSSGVEGYNYTLPSLKRGSRLLFQGDSITDMRWGRNERDRNHYLGHSYVYLIAARLGVEMPEAQLDVYNRGQSGNAVAQLRERWQSDAIDMKPDLLSILIGTNDVGKAFKASAGNSQPAFRGEDVEDFESNYRFILDASRKSNPGLRLVLLDPFVLPTGSLKNENAWTVRRQATDKLCAVIAKLATDYDAAHIKTQEVFDSAATGVSPEHWMWDGIHPLPQGHELIARNWLREVSARWPLGE